MKNLKKFFEKVEEVEIKKTNINSYNEMFITNFYIKNYACEAVREEKNLKYLGIQKS